MRTREQSIEEMERDARQIRQAMAHECDPDILDELQADLEILEEDIRNRQHDEALMFA